MAWDPESGQTFGEYMRGDDGRGPNVVVGERTFLTGDQVLEDTPTRRRVRDQLGNEVTERTGADGGYHRDVRINVR